MANTYLSRTPSSNGSKTTNTISLWVKRGKLGATQRLFSQLNTGGSGNPDDYIAFDDVDKINFQFYGDGTNGVNNGYLVTNRKFRDTSAWYHIVAVQDTTNGTSGNRLRLYVNGVRETSFSTENYPSQNTQGGAINNTSYPLFIGQRGNNAGYFDGSISHVHFSDGYAYEPTVFGSTDSTTGEWKINASPSFTPGTNGFTILKDGNTITDQSANSNNFSLGGGTLTKTEDNPSNVFATLNPLSHFFGTAPTFSNGNNTVTTSSASGSINPSPATLGITSGKWYWEGKLVNAPSSNYALIGIMAQAPAAAGGQNFLGGVNDTYGYASWNGTLYNSAGSTGNTSGGATYTTGDILSIAVDADNNRLYYYKNGTIQNSGTGIVIPAAADTLFGAWLPAVGDWDTPSLVWSCNFGNGFFGTTAVSSAGTNASGNGIFEYDVPTNYTALSTKGLNI